MQITDWLNQKFIEWQASQKRRKTISQFAVYLDIPQPVLSHYLNGRHIPTGENVYKLAERLGDEIYTILGVEAPDPLYRQIVKNWGEYTDDQRRHLSEMLDAFEQENQARAKTTRPAHQTQ
jgi:transcriptional regulator with XRE-family HTH domain